MLSCNIVISKYNHIYNYTPIYTLHPNTRNYDQNRCDDKDETLLMKGGGGGGWGGVRGELYRLVFVFFNSIICSAPTNLYC